MSKDVQNYPYMEYRTIVDAKIQQVFGKYNRINVNWLYDIILLCEKYDIDNALIADLISKLTTEENLLNMDKTKNFRTDSRNCKQEKSFFEYIENLNKENKQKYIQQGVLFALESGIEGQNVIDNFIKYIVLTNYSDIEYVSTIPSLNNNNTAFVNCYLGGLELCHNTSISISEQGNNDIECEWFHTRKGLQGLKLGAQVMRKLMQDVQKHFPDKNIISFNVQKKNLGAIRFYCNNGGELFDVNTAEKIEMSSLEPEAEGNIGVVFDRSKFQEIIDRKIILPEIDNKYLIPVEAKVENQEIQETEQELRTMIFDRITLDNESMINILCGGDYQLKKVLVGYGTAPKEVADKSREELERMYIERVGLDEIIAAREEVIKQDEISGEKRTHWYENTLQAMRMERGKTIMESEEFKSLKTKEEKRAFLDKLSITELEDVERYYTTARNFSKIAEEIVPTMM